MPFAILEHLPRIFEIVVPHVYGGDEPTPGPKNSPRFVEHRLGVSEMLQNRYGEDEIHRVIR